MHQFSPLTKAEEILKHYKLFPVNADGIRNVINDEELEKKHILFLGDSFVYGDHLKNHETIPHHFKNLLTNNDYSIWNFGVSGSSIDSSLLNLQQWCNSYSDNIHSVYFGITSKSRNLFWSGENNSYNHITGNVPDIENTVANEILIAKNMNKLASALEFQTTVLVYNTMQQLKNLSLIHNFNLMSFQTSDEKINDDAWSDIKESLEDERFIIRGEGNFWTSDIKIGRIPEYFLECGHWSSLGCKYMAENILYERTKKWYQ
tara:strand:- start:308 stop:1090 length:783 start_codon:yes stop_codon:yes gene_type:complete